MFHCLICHQEFEFERVFEVDFLWNDDLYHGKPVCKGCAKVLEGHPHLNYDIKKDPGALKKLLGKVPGRKKTLDKWL